MTTTPIPNRGGRPVVWTPCGWCGDKFPAGQIRAHFKGCPQRPADSDRQRKGRRAPKAKNAWRLMTKYFQTDCMKLEARKNAGKSLEECLSGLAWMYERLVWGMQDEWRRLPDAPHREVIESEHVDTAPWPDG